MCIKIVDVGQRVFCLQCLEKGDIVMGIVSAVQDAGLLITLFCLDGGKVRDIDELSITVSEICLLCDNSISKCKIVDLSLYPRVRSCTYPFIQV